MPEGKKEEPDRIEVGRESPRGMERRSDSGLGSLAALPVHFTVESGWKWQDLRCVAKGRTAPCTSWLSDGRSLRTPPGQFADADNSQIGSLCSSPRPSRRTPVGSDGYLEETSD